eukprot:563551-Rhodomonas_salina.1
MTVVAQSTHRLRVDARLSTTVADRSLPICRSRCSIVANCRCLINAQTRSRVLTVDHCLLLIGARTQARRATVVDCLCLFDKEESTLDRHNGSDAYSLASLPLVNLALLLPLEALPLEN